MTFNSSYNHESVVDEEFSAMYLQLATNFANESKNTTGDAGIRHKARLSGLKALESLCDNESFLKRSDANLFIDLIIPCILLNISEQGKVKTPENMTPRRLSIQDQLITDDELKNISKHCLSLLFSTTIGNSLKLIMTPFYKYLF